jgi:hypothetical protein
MKVKKYLVHIILIFCALACTAQKTIISKDTSADELEKKINLFNSNWNSLSLAADLSFENITSWLPKQGIRGRYEIVKNYLGKSILENIVGEKVFLEGPHSEQINYRSLKNFGKYNPVFLTKLSKKLTILLENETFVSNAKPLYDNQLKNYLRVYFLSYHVAVNKQQIMDGYMAVISNESDPASTSKDLFLSNPSWFLQESFRDFSDSLDEQYDIYEGFTCPGFWVRRSIDETSDEFYNLLMIAMKTFDQDFIISQKIE